MATSSSGKQQQRKLVKRQPRASFELDDHLNPNFIHANLNDPIEPNGAFLPPKFSDAAGTDKRSRWRIYNPFHCKEKPTTKPVGAAVIHVSELPLKYPSLATSTDGTDRSVSETSSDRRRSSGVETVSSTASTSSQWSERESQLSTSLPKSYHYETAPLKKRSTAPASTSARHWSQRPDMSQHAPFTQSNSMPDNSSLYPARNSLDCQRSLPKKINPNQHLAHNGVNRSMRRNPTWGRRRPELMSRASPPRLVTVQEHPPPTPPQSEQVGRPQPPPRSPARASSTSTSKHSPQLDFSSYTFSRERQTHHYPPQTHKFHSQWTGLTSQDKAVARSASFEDFRSNAAHPYDLTNQPSPQSNNNNLTPSPLRIRPVSTKTTQTQSPPPQTLPEEPHINLTANQQAQDLFLTAPTPPTPSIVPQPPPRAASRQQQRTREPLPLVTTAATTATTTKQVRSGLGSRRGSGYRGGFWEDRCGSGSSLQIVNA